ncbi:MAG: MFS transporter [Actinobacteria bacterium]|nr:MFS transporter [Actinomycetota bacterium]
MSETTSHGRVAFRSPAFRHYFALRVLARLGIDMLITAVGWQVYQLTGEALSLGIVGLAQFAPFLLLFLAAGEVSDRFSRIRILTVTLGMQALGAAVFLALTLTGRESFGAIVVILIGFGVSRAFQTPAAAAIVPLLVPPEHFGNAVAWSTMGFSAARIAGPALAGGLLVAGEGVVYGTVTVILTVAVVLTLFVHPARQETSHGKVTLDRVLAGFRFIWSREIVLGAITLDLFAVLLGGATALLPIFATDILGVGEVGFGVLRASVVVGSVAGAAALTRWPIRRHAGPRLLVAVAVFGLAICGFGLSTSFWLSVAALFVMGAADSVSMYVRQNLVQVITPDEMRGRVSAVNGIFIGASNELGEFESGVTAAWWGVVPAVLVGGIGTIVVAAASLVVFPRLRTVDSLDPDELVRNYRGGG